MDLMKTLLIYMSATMALAVNSTAAPKETPVPTPAATAIVETVDTQAENPEKLIYDIQLIQTDLAFSSMKALYDPQPFEELKQDVRDGKANRIDCIYRIKEILCNFHIVPPSLIYAYYIITILFCNIFLHISRNNFKNVYFYMKIPFSYIKNHLQVFV